LGDCLQVLDSLPPESIDLVFADPPYNLTLNQELWRPNMTKVEAVRDDWDQFADFQEYDQFTREWLQACKRVLKKTGAIWVIGTYHNIYRVGKIMQDLGFWFLNDIVWVKTNPMPNFHGVRYTNAHETLLWASKSQGTRYTFNYHAMKGINDELQMRSDWTLPLCKGPERIRINGKRAHSTQKPEALLYRIILSSSLPQEIVLDPFFGTGTTGVVAKRLHRHWIGIEKEEAYVKIAQERIEQTPSAPFDPGVFEVRSKRRRSARIPFASLLENGLLLPGQALYFRKDRNLTGTVKPDGKIIVDGFVGTIHQSCRFLTGGKPGNAWDLWFYESSDGDLLPIDDLRETLRERIKETSEASN